MSEQKDRCQYEMAIENWLGKQQFETMHPDQLQQLVRLLSMFDADKARHKDAVEYLMQQVDQMRGFQKAYFARGAAHEKNAAMDMEKKVDSTIIKYKGRGYDGKRFIDKTSQSKLF